MKMTEVQKAAQDIVKIAADMIYKDSHCWSKRPCSTCHAITNMLGFDFGCIRKAKEHVDKDGKES